ncbi:MAG TPA: LLM class F420-dependent oxidoreductase [Mycobacteriales bacterium]|nr:LLM class F420-dependent oxidoreductase [Mycobacteriales bacterium]
MRFSVQYPMPADQPVAPDAMAADIAAWAGTVEAAGFDAIAFTEHPAPSRKWLENGGHASFDPYVALSYCAALTSRLRLLAFLAVLPYRNPLLTARAAVSVDVLSRGRLTLTCGTGYLRSEFAALGVDFEERNARFDEALEVLNRAWAEPESVQYDGRGFTAREQAFRPGPIQPRAPLWIGGNSTTARERVVRHGIGWAPLMASAELSKTSRTPQISDLPALTSAIADLHDRLERAGRDPATIDVCLAAGNRSPIVDREGNRFNAEAELDWIGQVTAAGVTWIGVSAYAAHAAANADALAAYGEQVIQRVRA